VIYYAVALANVYGVDLEEALRLKEALNAQKYPQRG
jgi:NTP pyrophosphatase (non-canonical NTP hydrolase)